MKVLVTGGAGFIGSHIVDQLVDAGTTCACSTCCCRWPMPHRPDYLNPGAEFIRADVADREALASALDGVDAVSHQAAMVGLGVDFGDAPDYVRHNDLGTAVLLRELAGRRFAGRLALASSMVVYGEGRYRCAEHGEVSPGPRLVEDLEAGRFEARCGVCSGPLTPRRSARRGDWTPATSMPPPSSIRSTCAPRSPASRTPQ